MLAGLERMVGTIVTLLVFGLAFIGGLVAFIKLLDHQKPSQMLLELALIGIAAWLVYSAAHSAMPWAFR
jgi:hypothetical protein